MTGITTTRDEQPGVVKQKADVPVMTMAVMTAGQGEKLEAAVTGITMTRDQQPGVDKQEVDVPVMMAASAEMPPRDGSSGLTDLMTPGVAIDLMVAAATGRGDRHQRQGLPVEDMINR